MDETIVVSSIIDKLPFSWRDFREALNIKRKKLLLIIFLTIFLLKRNFACKMRTKILLFLKCMWLKKDTLASSQTKGRINPMITHKIRGKKKANAFSVTRNDITSLNANFLKRKKRKKDPQVEQIKIWLL